MEENILNDRNGLDVIVKGPYKRGKKVEYSTFQYLE